MQQLLKVAADPLAHLSLKAGDAIVLFCLGVFTGAILHKVVQSFFTICAGWFFPV